MYHDPTKLQRSSPEADMEHISSPKDGAKKKKKKFRCVADDEQC